MASFSGPMRHEANAPVARRAGSPDALLIALMAANLLLFVAGWLGHAGVDIPLGFATWDEPRVIPAAIVEGLGALSLAIALTARLTRQPNAERIARMALWYCFLGVLWGMVRLSMGSIPAARTEANDFLHIAMTLLSTLALVRLTALEGAAGGRRDE